jgi:hypothetical protein
MRPGFAISSSLAGPVAAPVSARGTHGYSPEHPELASFFAVAGPGIRPVPVGAIDMRSIAPTLAALMNTTLASADLPPLPIR